MQIDLVAAFACGACPHSEGQRHMTGPLALR
jgi:hypothetical protein